MDDERRGNIAAARTKAKISLCLNVAAFVAMIIMWGAVATAVAITIQCRQTDCTAPLSPIS